MAGIVPSFLSSAKLVIKMGSIELAYGSNLSFNDRMAVAPVGGIGSYNSDALEPLQYTAGGSFTITVYSSGAVNSLANSSNIPDRALKSISATAKRNGNSMLVANNFSPAALMISQTFDIDVYERVGQQATSATQNLLLTYQLTDCRLTSYSMTFTPGSLVQENVGFLCIGVKDRSLLPA